MGKFANKVELSKRHTRHRTFSSLKKSYNVLSQFLCCEIFDVYYFKCMFWNAQILPLKCHHLIQFFAVCLYQDQTC